MIQVPRVLLFQCVFQRFLLPHTSVTVGDIFMKFYRNLNQVKIMCCIQLLLLSVSELWPFACVLCLLCIIDILYMP